MAKMEKNIGFTHSKYKIGIFVLVGGALEGQFVGPMLGLEPTSFLKHLPDEPFHNLRASRSGDWRILCSSRTSCDGFRTS